MRVVFNIRYCLYPKDAVKICLFSTGFHPKAYSIKCLGVFNIREGGERLEWLDRGTCRELTGGTDEPDYCNLCAAVLQSREMLLENSC